MLMNIMARTVQFIVIDYFKDMFASVNCDIIGVDFSLFPQYESI